MKRLIAALATVAVLAPTLSACVSSGERRPARAAEASGYVVQPGDTLSSIAVRYGVQMSALARANAIAPPYLIRVGQRLAIPQRASVTALRTESRPVVQPLPQQQLPRATTPPVPRPQVGAAPPFASAPAFVGPAPRLVWPADGPVSAPFGTGTDPRGLTFAAHRGAAVRAAAGGKVLFAGVEPARYGQLVLVDHGGGWVSAYAHMARIVVSEGETVNSGARLGFVGTTSAGGASQLHFELRRNNQPVDPVPLFPPRF